GMTGLGLAAWLLAGAPAASPTAPSAAAPVAAVAAAPLGVTYAAWKGGYAAAARRLATFREIGFQIVSLVPTYAYAGLDRITPGSGPDPAELGRTVEAALRGGFAVVIKPHLDPPLYQSGFDPFRSENDSWRVHC